MKRPASSASIGSADEISSVAKRPAAAIEDGNDLPALEDGTDLAFTAETFNERLEQFKRYSRRDGDAVQRTPAEPQASLRRFFSEGEMSNWWNKLNRDRQHDPGFRENMDSVVRGSSLPQAAAKRGVLALRIIDPCKFKEMVATQSTEVRTLERACLGGEWRSRGMLCQMLGETEALRKIARGKYECRFDSDDDSEYYVPYEKSENAVEKIGSTKADHKTEGKTEDYDTLKKAVGQKFKSLKESMKPGSSTRSVPALPDSTSTPGPSVSSAETDEERIERLLQERKEQAKEKKQQEKAAAAAARAAAPRAERIVLDAEDAAVDLKSGHDKLRSSCAKLGKTKSAASVIKSANDIAKRCMIEHKNVTRLLKTSDTKELQLVLKRATKLLEAKTAIEKPLKVFM